MPKDEWGVKRACPKCSVRFYDLQKDPMTCPSCGASFDVASLVQQKTRSVASEKTAKAITPVAKSDEDTDVVDLDDDDEIADDLDDDLDDDLLDDDDDDDVSLDDIADVAGDDDDN
ncbi:MAG: TIGR02300 family protein [Rhodobacteraceae bacterium]|nr:TIGR02300 family protein [Paracoccaceae bacterium]